MWTPKPSVGHRAAGDERQMVGVVTALGDGKAGVAVADHVDRPPGPCRGNRVAHGRELARQAGESGGTYPCVYNAANEVAVQAFLDGRLSFLGIADAVDEALTAADGAPARDLDELTEADTAARRVVARV